VKNHIMIDQFDELSGCYSC